MKHICLDCYNKENNENRTEDMVEMSAENFVCESCGRKGKIIVKVIPGFINYGDFYVNIREAAEEISKRSYVNLKENNFSPDFFKNGKETK